MIPVNYHHLYYFWRIAKAGSIAKAREELFLSQPTLSLQLQELERSLGVRLLYRGRTGVSLTPDGRAAFEYCERIFSQGDQLVAALKEGERSRPPVIRLGVVRSVSKETVLPVVESVRARRRDARTNIFGGTAAELEERLDRHAVDLVVSDSNFSIRTAGAFRSRLVARIPIRFVAAPRLAKALKRFPPRPYEMPMLLRTPDIPVRRQVDEYMRRRRERFGVSIAAEIDDPDLIRALALQGAGVAALNELAIKSDVAQGRLVRLEGDEPGIREEVWFICSAEPHSHPAVREVVDELMSSFKIGPRAGAA